jgi:hypothetical protein
MTLKSLELLSDGDRWMRFSEACVKRAGQFETARLVEHYESFYQRLLDARECG